MVRQARHELYCYNQMKTFQRSQAWTQEADMVP